MIISAVHYIELYYLQQYKKKRAIVNFFKRSRQWWLIIYL